jgi:ATP-binding cassette, subfamily A (ABC1), member 3
MGLQNALDQEIIKTITGATVNFPPLFIHRFPFPEHINDFLGVILAFTIPTIIVVAFLYSALNNIKYIAIEKELQLKETMKIMGLPGYLHWTAWFTKCMIFQLIIVSIIVGIMKIPVQGDLSVFNLTDWTVLWVFLFLYSLAGVTFSFMFSTFFAKANMAAIVGALAWLMMLQPYAIININYENFSLSAKLATCLLVNSGMGFGFKVLGLYESAQIGVQWSNLFTPVTPDDDMTLGYIMIVLFIAFILQFLIALYVEKINPGDYGMPEPWYFPFSPKFWCSSKTSSTDINNFPIKTSPNFESEPMDKKAGIKIRGLRKLFGKKVAVDNLHLNLYEDQITVLLGNQM